MTRHLTLEDVHALHERVMRRFGSAGNPLRDANALASAIARTQAAEFYEGADVVRQAALMTVGISQAQAFLDGNKRTALAACHAFLGANGYARSWDSVEFAKQLELVAERVGERDAATDDFEAWLRERTAALTP